MSAVVVVFIFLGLLWLIEKAVDKRRQTRSGSLCRHGVQGYCDRCYLEASEQARLIEQRRAESIHQEYLSVPEDVRKRLTQFATDNPERGFALTGTDSIELAVIAMFRRSPTAAKLGAPQAHSDLEADL